MYGGLFAVAVLIITSAMAAQAFLFYRNLMRNDLTEAVGVVGGYIESGGQTDASSLNKLQVKNSINIAVWELPLTRIFINRALFSTRAPLLQVVELAPAQQQTRRGPFHLSEEGTFEHAGRRFFVRASMDDGWARYAISILGAIFIIILATGVAGAFAVGRLLSKRMLRPVTDMINLASEISIEDLGRRIDAGGPEDEIGLLARAFNEMIGRLEDSFEKQSRFISDASHELRTPISVIQGYANLLARWGKDDPEILSESIESIKTETERMGTLVKKLLFLANYDHNPRRAAIDVVSVNACLHEILREVHVMELGHKVELIENAEVFIEGDYNLLKQAFWIFIENSMKYAKNNTAEITVVISDESGARVSIKDEGIGIMDADIPHIFDRFYRGDKSRSRETPGAGLGLSIADRILKTLRARVSVVSEWGKGTEIIIQFDARKNDPGD